MDVVCFRLWFAMALGNCCYAVLLLLLLVFGAWHVAGVVPWK